MKKMYALFAMIVILQTVVLLSQEKRDVLIKKYFRNSSTFIIECKGYPKDGLTGKPAVETAKEAALTNAQFITRDLFSPPVDAVKNGAVEKYMVYRDYVIIRYTVKYPGLKAKLRKK